ncbi:MAG: beta-galactosidase [Lentisphaeria bacterium]|nr:beta-galactosidase [Lentisphaeria bacterium]
MKRFLFIPALLAFMVSGAELSYKNDFFSVRFDTKGAVIKELIHRNQNWNGSSKAGNSFGEMRIGCATGEKSQEHENFEKYDFTLKEWKELGRNTVHITFTACGNVFKNIRLNKTYKFNHYRPDEMIVEYELVNSGTKPQSIFLSTRTFFRRSGQNNTYFQPRAKGDAALVQSKYLEFSMLPPRRYLAVAGDDKSGLVLAFPADSVTGFMNWFLKEGYPTQEYFSDERIIAPGASRKISVKMLFVKDVKKTCALSSMKCTPIKGKIPPQVEQLNRQEDPSYKVRVLKAANPENRNFADITLNRQFNDSWRAVTLPAEAQIKNIAVFEVENGSPAFDRPVTFALKGRELLLFIPGLLPGQSLWNAGIVDGFYQSRRGAQTAAGPIAVKCRIYFDHPGGRKVADAPAGGELYINGSFEKADPKNPKVPHYSQFVSNPHRKVVWRKEGGVNNSACLEGGSAIFSFFPEAGVTYDLSVKLKNVGGGGRMWLYLTFYDAGGKMMTRNRKLLFCSDNAFEWKEIKKSFIPPRDAAAGEVTVSRAKRNGLSIMVDDFSVKASPVSCVKISPKEMARRELVKQWDIPINELESISTAAAFPLKKWFIPSDAPIDLLVLPCENRVGRLLGAKQEIAELASRHRMNLKCIPIIREPVSSTGSYGVWVMNFKKTLSAYTAESLKEIKKAPKVVLLTAFQEKLHSRDFFDILAKWQKAGTHFIFFNCTPPKSLKGKRCSAPVSSVLPRMRNVKADGMFEWYKKGSSYVVVSKHSVSSNPTVEEEEQTMAHFHKARTGRDFPWWEYSYLPDLQVLRFLSGIKSPVKFVSGDEKSIVCKADAPFKGTLEVVYRNRYRELKGGFSQALDLKTGVTNVALPAQKLPGGLMVAEVRLLNAGGAVVDAGAFRFDRKAETTIEVKFADAERIFPRGKGIDFTLFVKNAPPHALVETEIEDVFGRVIYRKISPANAQMVFAVPDLERTCLNNLFVRVKKEGVIIAENMTEFSSPQGKPDFLEYKGIMWGNSSIVKREMGIVGATLGNVDWANTPVYIRAMRLLNVDPSPMGMYKYGKTAHLYRNDRKSKPVRTPCFSDPAFHKANSERLAKYAKISRYRYYDVQNYWSGDEQYLGASVCYSPHCLKLFREYLKKEYKNIAALNKEWESSFKSFDEVTPEQQDELKSKNNLAPWLDHKLFMAQVYAKGQFGFFARELEKYSCHIKFGPSGTANPGLGYDWYQMMKYCKLLSYYSGIQVKLIHDFGGKEIRAGKWGGYCHAHIDAEPYIYDPMWEGLLRGANMAAVWPPIMTNGDGTPLRNFFHASRSLKELTGGIGKMWLSADRKAEIAILYSQSSLYTAMNSVGNAQWQNSQSSWVKLLEDLKYDCRFISYEELAEKGVAKEYKVLILPCALSLSEKESAAIAEFVKRGGTVIADIAPGRYDGHGKRWNNPLLAHIFPPNTGEIKSTLQTSAALKGKFLTGEKSLGIETVKKYGKGRGVLLNLVVGQYHFITLGGTGGEISKATSGDAKLQMALRTLVNRYLKEADVKCEVSVMNAKGAEFPCLAAMRYDKGGRILFLHQTGGEGERFNFKEAVPVTVKLSEKGHIYDVRGGKYLGYTDTFKSAILPAWSKIYSIQKTKVTALKVTAPGRVKAGDIFKVGFTAGNASGAQVFHVELADPSGKVDPVATGNFRSESASGSCQLQVPFNGAKGIWQVYVKHVNTGISKKVRIEVK